MDHGTFEAHRPLLFSIAYRMLGEIGEAEDVVQDVYLRAAGTENVRDPRAFLVAATTRQSIDRLRSARRRRERYVGPWLPEPLVGTAPDAAEEAERAESLSLAFLVVLESLTAAERAAFLLRDVFGFSYAEVAAAIGKTEDATRQLAHRARQALASGRRRSNVAPGRRRELLERFLAACSGHDLEGLTAMLAEDAVAYTDGGGEARAARRPIHGRDNVARFLVGVAKKAPPDTAVEVVAVNGQEGLLLVDSGVPVAVVDLVVGDGLVEQVLVVAAPSKLAAAAPA